MKLKTILRFLKNCIKYKQKRPQLQNDQGFQISMYSKCCESHYLLFIKHKQAKQGMFLYAATPLLKRFILLVKILDCCVQTQGHREGYLHELFVTLIYHVPLIVLQPKYVC